jgi:hypothetical protein
MRIRLEGEIPRELQIQFLKPLFGTNSSATGKALRIRSREIFALILVLVSIALLVVVNLLTHWNPETLFTVEVGILIGLLSFGFGPRVKKYFEKYEHDSKERRREHTKNLYKEVYKPLSRLFADANPKASYTIEHRVPYVSKYGQDIAIPFNELPHWDRGIAHLRSGKPYRDIYKVWEDTLTLNREFNDLHLKLRQEVEKLIVQKMQERFSLSHQQKFPPSQAGQGCFYSEGFVNVIMYELGILQQNSSLKPDFERHFEITDWNSVDGHWWLLEREGHKLLQTRDSWTDEDADNLTLSLIEIESNPQILQAANELYKCHGEIQETLRRFRKEIKILADQINDIEDNYIIEGKCEVGY